MGTLWLVVEFLGARGGVGWGGGGGVFLVDIIVLSMGLQTSSTASDLFLTLPLGIHRQV